MRSNNPGSLQNHPTWNRLSILFFGLLLSPAVIWLLISCFINPVSLSFLRSIPAITTAVFLLLLHRFRIIRAIHEGLHAIAAHWFGVPSALISATNTFVFVSVTDKTTWYKITLYPLLFPFALFLLFLPWNWKIGLLLSSIIATGSSQDLANLVMVSRAKGNWVSDTAEGLFVFETPPEYS